MVWRVPQNIKLGTARRPSNSTCGKVRSQVSLCTRVFGAALFTIATRWEHPQCPRVDTQGVAPTQQQVTRLTKEGHSDIRYSRMNLEDGTQSETSQSPQGK